MKHALGAPVLAGLTVAPAAAQDTGGPGMTEAAVAAQSAAPAAPADPLRFDLGDGSIKFALEAGAQVVAEFDAFWNLAEGLAPAEKFDPDPVWGEFYVEAGATVEQPIGGSSVKLGL